MDMKNFKYSKQITKKYGKKQLQNLEIYIVKYSRYFSITYIWINVN